MSSAVLDAANQCDWTLDGRPLTFRQGLSIFMACPCDECTSHPWALFNIIKYTSDTNQLRHWFLKL